MLQADFFQRALPWTQLIHREADCMNDLNTGISGRASVMLTFGLLSRIDVVTLAAAFLWLGPL